MFWHEAYRTYPRVDVAMARMNISALPKTWFRQLCFYTRSILTYIAQLGDNRIRRDTSDVHDDSRGTHSGMLLERAGGVCHVDLGGIVAEVDGQGREEETCSKSVEILIGKNVYGGLNVTHPAKAMIKFFLVQPLRSISARLTPSCRLSASCS